MHSSLSGYTLENQCGTCGKIDSGSMPHGAVSKRHGSGKVGLLGLDASMTSEILRIAVEDETVFTGMKIDGIIGERLRGIHWKAYPGWSRIPECFRQSDSPLGW